MLLDTPGASLFGNMLAGKGVMISGYDNKRDGVRKAGYSSKFPV